MTEVLDYLNKNSGAFTVIFTAVVTVATAIYAALTWILVKETRLIREVQTEPKIEITLKSMEIAIHFVRLHVCNIGLGPALNVRFTPRALAGGDTAQKLIAEFTKTNFFLVGLAYFGPGQERISNYTKMTEDYEGKISSAIAFDIEYESATGKRYKETVCVDLSEQKGAYQLGKPHMYAIAHSLEMLQKDVGHIVSGFKRIKSDVYTAEDRQSEETAWRASYGEDKKDSSVLQGKNERLNANG